MTIIGLDLGARGAIAELDEGGELLQIHDMPSLDEGNGRPATNAPLLAAILAKMHARVIFCEFVGARPTDARATAFAFGRARGCIEGAAGALGLPIVALAVAAYGWRAGFLMTGILSLIYAVVFWLLYRNPSESRRSCQGSP